MTFKPDIDDLRESKALEVAETLLSEGYEINAVEPNIQSHKNFSLLNLSDAVEQSDIICVLVRHREFLNLEIKKNYKNITHLIFVDLFSKSKCVF